jgi:hypothetical protein
VGKKRGKTNKKKCVRRVYRLLLRLLSADRPLDDSTRLTRARRRRALLIRSLHVGWDGGVAEMVWGCFGRTNL